MCPIVALPSLGIHGPEIVIAQTIDRPGGR
jgi:hypothetical protein